MEASEPDLDEVDEAIAGGSGESEIRRPGTLLLDGKYRLDAPLAVGGMSTVWLGTHVTLGRAVAIKFVEVRGNDRKRATDRFLREARLAAAIHHPNVIDVLDFGVTAQDEPFLVMERLDGYTLADRMAMTPALTTAQVCHVMVQVLGALDAVHRAGIVHCDLKPENVMLERELDSRGNPFARLIDFGIAHSTDPTSDLRRGRFGTDTHIITGTPEYMAPEQAEGRRDLDVRVDVYAASVMLYELLSGNVPFSGDTPGRIIHKVMSGHHVPLAELRPDIPELADVVWMGMSLDRTHRPASAKELSRRIEEAFEMPSASRPPSKVPSVPPEVAATVKAPRVEAPTMEAVEDEAPPPRARRMSFPAIAGVCLVGGLLLVGAYVATRPSSEDRPPTATASTPTTTLAPSAPATTPPVATDVGDRALDEQSPLADEDEGPASGPSPRRRRARPRPSGVGPAAESHDVVEFVDDPGF